jgi:hypothetical protein
MSLGSNGCFMASATLTDSHFMMDIIGNVDHPTLNSIMLLVLCTVAYNIRGTGIVLQVSRDSANSVGNG